MREQFRKFDPKMYLFKILPTGIQFWSINSEETYSDLS